MVYVLNKHIFTQFDGVFLNRAYTKLLFFRTHKKLSKKLNSYFSENVDTGVF